jgi:hypothetical protein
LRFRVAPAFDPKNYSRIGFCHFVKNACEDDDRKAEANRRAAEYSRSAPKPSRDSTEEGREQAERERIAFADSRQAPDPDRRATDAARLLRFASRHSPTERNRNYQMLLWLDTKFIKMTKKASFCSQIATHSKGYQMAIYDCNTYCINLPRRRAAC